MLAALAGYLFWSMVLMLRARSNLIFPALHADWYVANLHKWYFVPRGCGFLWAAAGARTGLLPNVLSSDIAYSFPYNFGWTGTRDPVKLAGGSCRI